MQTASPFEFGDVRHRNLSAVFLAEGVGHLSLAYNSINEA